MIDGHHTVLKAGLLFPSHFCYLPWELTWEAGGSAVTGEKKPLAQDPVGAVSPKLPGLPSLRGRDRTAHSSSPCRSSRTRSWAEKLQRWMWLWIPSFPTGCYTKEAVFLFLCPLKIWVWFAREGASLTVVLEENTNWENALKRQTKEKKKRLHL